MDERLKDFTVEQLANELTARREASKTEQRQELRRIGNELKTLHEAFEKCSGWKLSDWRTWKA